MKFNLGFTATIAVAAFVTIGHLVADAANEQGARFLLLLCIASAAAVTVWRTRNLDQEPAVFVTVTYLLLGAVVGIAQAAAGEYTQAVIIAITLPLIPCTVVVDPRMRRWVNRIARSPETDLRDDEK